MWRSSMACKANICSEHYETDSSGKKPDNQRLEDKWSAEALQPSYIGLFDISILTFKELESCIYFGVLLGGLGLSVCTLCLL